MAIVRFEANIPQQITLRQAAGRPVTGQFGEEFFHTLADGNQCYLKPVVEEQIAMLGVQDGETVEIVRKLEGKSSRWVVRRPETTTPNAPAPTTTEQRIAEPVQAKVQQTQDTPKQDGAARMVAGALIAAIDAIVLAKQYAEKKGIPASFELDYNAEDVRAIASTLLIQHYRGLENAMRYGSQPAQNGGNAWQQ